ncbi:PspA/IM30 family protein [Bhargavaea cecembensis]|uniref:PspA/IM30 family protein n=1 Tax=Bhargavaea cecembensis TaxID=394098 RepID=UPI00058D3984|nr:PspA/IM30 family protein [Bhargavaea cecembensis]
MNSIWNRIKYTVQADLHDLLDKKEQHNPIALLNEYIRAAEKQTDATGKLLDRQGKLKQELEKERQEAAAMLEKRRGQLELAEKAGEEDLAAFARDEVKAYGTRVGELENSILDTDRELLALERKYEEMKHKVKDMKVRQLQLMGKENATRAHRRMDAVIRPEDNGSLASYGEMQEYIDGLAGRKQPQPEADRSSMERRLDALTIIEECEKESV